MRRTRQDNDLLRGAMDLLLLASLEAGPTYGLRIIQDVQDRTGGHVQFKQGTLYPALHRLEQRALIRAESRPSESGGPPRKYYHLTAAGREALARERAVQRAHVTALRSYLDPT